MAPALRLYEVKTSGMICFSVEPNPSSAERSGYGNVFSLGDDD